MIDELYPRALDAGMKSSEFWGYSFAEVNDYLESRERRRMQEVKLSAIKNCQLGYIVAANVSRFMGQNAEPIRPWDLYPNLFVTEREAYELEVYKQKRREYAEEVNKRRREV